VQGLEAAAAELEQPLELGQQPAGQLGVL
jgi:hypothetical protein